MRGPPWRDEETEFLREHYLEKGAVWCAEQLGRPYNTVQVRASKHGISKSKRAWEESDNEFLRQHYPEHGAFWCAKQLNRALSNVQYRARLLKLAKPRRQYGTYKALAPVIEEMYSAGIGPTSIAEVLGLSFASLKVRIHEWGLFEVRELYRADLAREIAAKHGIEVDDA